LSCSSKFSKGPSFRSILNSRPDKIKEFIPFLKENYNTPGLADVHILRQTLPVDLLTPHISIKIQNKFRNRFEETECTFDPVFGQEISLLRIKYKQESLLTSNHLVKAKSSMIFSCIFF